MNPINIIHVVPSLDSRTGGPARTVTQLVSSLLDNSKYLPLLVTQSSVNSKLILPDGCVDTVLVKSYFGLYSNIFLYYFRLRNLIKVKNPKIIHSHGIWHPINFIASFLAIRFNIPLIIHPRGMLEPWSLNHKRFFKFILLKLFQKRHLNYASVIIATSHQEYLSVRKAGFQNPIAIIPNGYEKGTGLVAQHSFNNNQRILFFLSRIHPKKGIENLLQAWSEIKLTNWRLVIAGPGNFLYLNKLKNFVNNKNILNVEFVGELVGPEKELYFMNSSIFILPSFSENFGVVVAEALSYHVPVITTKGTPWSDLVQYDCGWWIDNNIDDLKNVIIESTNISDDRRRQMGLNGANYVSSFNLDKIGNSISLIYDWTLNSEKISIPEFLILD